jgi:hypothetical protein
MLTAATPENLAAAFLLIEAWQTTPAWSSNLCLNGTFTGGSSTWWTFNGNVGVVDEHLHYDDADSADATYTPLSPSIGKTYKITFDRLNENTDAAAFFTMGGHTGALRLTPGTWAEQFTATASDPLVVYSAIDGENDDLDIDNVIIQEWLTAAPLLDSMLLNTDVSSALPRAGGYWHTRVKVFHLATGHQVYNDSRQLTLIGKFHD